MSLFRISLKGFFWANTGSTLGCSKFCAKIDETGPNFQSFLFLCKSQKTETHFRKFGGCFNQLISKKWKPVRFSICNNDVITSLLIINVYIKFSNDTQFCPPELATILAHRSAQDRRYSRRPVRTVDIIYLKGLGKPQQWYLSPIRHHW